MSILLPKERKELIQEYRERCKTKDKEDLIDCCYLDYASIGFLKEEGGKLQQYPVTVLTLDNPAATFNRLMLYRIFLNSFPPLPAAPNLKLVFLSKVIFLKKNQNKLDIDGIFNHFLDRD